jgi:hypothetical protein
MLKNNYTYVSNFSQFVSVNLYHSYYKDNLLRDIEVLVDKETSTLLKSYGILIRAIENGFALITKKDAKFKANSFAGKLKLKFVFKLKNASFLNITDIPYSNNQKFVFQNTQDHSSEKLHSDLRVDEKNIEKTSEYGLFGEIYLTLNSKNQFFGSDMAGETLDELKYSIYFAAREVKFRYNFYSTEPIVDFEKYFITDEQNSFKMKKYDTRVLANGTLVYYFVLEDSVLVSQSYTKKLYLKKDDDFLTYFSIFLPYPKPSTINFDIGKNLFYNDVFVKI